MRDLALTMLVLGALPLMVRRPYIGLLFWMWLGFMNPHRLTWGFAFDFPFVQLAAIATLIGMLVDQERRRLPLNAVTTIWLMLIVWCTVTTLTALNPDLAWPEWARFVKIQVMVLVMIVLLDSPHRLRWAALVTAASICFYGVKGGIFTILTGGQHMVLGPRNSFIGGNTEIAFAIVICMPLLWWARSQFERPIVRVALIAAFGLCVVAVLGSYSRGAVLSIVAMLGFLWLRSKGKLMTAAVGIAAVLVGLSLMPEKWFDRMETIGGELDNSELGRINAWWFAINLANDRPIVGGGFRAFSPEHFLRYAPDGEFFRDAHSIFFEVLGEHGYVGLVLFVLMGLATVWHAWQRERMARRIPELAWAGDLLRASQVSLVGYVVGGLFLGLAYFDLPYAIMALIVATGELVRRTVGTAEGVISSPQQQVAIPAAYAESPQHRAT